MIVAVALTLQKHEGLGISTKSFLSILYDCVSCEEALGKSVICAIEENPNYCVVSKAFHEVTPPPKENQGGMAELHTTAKWRSLCKWLRIHFAI